MSRQEAIARLICHIYVEQLPKSSLQELYETLHDMYEFYGKPAIKEPPLTLPVIIKAKVAEPIVRPDFSVDYEE